MARAHHHACHPQIPVARVPTRCPTKAPGMRRSTGATPRFARWHRPGGQKCRHIVTHALCSPAARRDARTRPPYPLRSPGGRVATPGGLPLGDRARAERSGAACSVAMQWRTQMQHSAAQHSARSAWSRGAHAHTHHAARMRARLLCGDVPTEKNTGFPERRPARGFAGVVEGSGLTASGFSLLHPTFFSQFSANFASRPPRARTPSANLPVRPVTSKFDKTNLPSVLMWQEFLPLSVRTCPHKDI